MTSSNRMMIAVGDFLDDKSSSSLVATAVGVVALSAAFFVLNNKKKTDSKTNIPYAPTGMFENAVALGSCDAPFWVLETARRLESMNFAVQLPGMSFYVIGDHKTVKAILKDSKSDKPRMIYKAFEGVGAKTMFTSGNDPYMKSLRKSTAHAFSRNEVGRMNTVAAKFTKQFLDGRLKEYADNNQSFDPSHEMNYITFQVICEAAFEYQVSEEEFEVFGHHAEISSKEFIGKSPMNPLRPMFGRFIPEVRQARTSSIALIDFAGVVLDVYRKNPNKSTNNTLVKIINENQSIQDDFQRKSELKDWLAAGHETTGYSLSNTLTLLALNPKYQTKLRQELMEFKGDRVEECPYFQYVLKESMRVMPVAAGGSGRVTGREFVMDDCKQVLPANSICFFNQYLMNRDPDVYDNPDTFNPDRWATPTEEMKVAMAPFAVGSRSCPGQSLAMSEIHYVLPALLKEYEFEVVEEGTRTFFLTLKYKGTRLRAKKL